MLDKLYDKFFGSTFIISFVVSLLLTMLEFKILGFVEDQDIVLLFIANMIVLISIIMIIDKFLKRGKEDVKDGVDDTKK